MTVYLSAEQAQEIHKDNKFIKNKIFEYIKDKIGLAAAQGYYTIIVLENDIPGISHCIHRFSKEEIEGAFPGMNIKIQEGRIQGMAIGCAWVPAKVEISWGAEQ